MPVASPGVRVFLLRRRAVAALGALVLAGAIFYDDHVISAIRSMGMEPIQWNVEQPEMT